MPKPLNPNAARVRRYARLHAIKPTTASNWERAGQVPARHRRMLRGVRVGGYALAVLMQATLTTPAALAGALGCTPEAVRYWVAGKRLPRPAMHRAIEDFFAPHMADVKARFLPSGKVRPEDSPRRGRPPKKSTQRLKKNAH